MLLTSFDCELFCRHLLYCFDLDLLTVVKHLFCLYLPLQSNIWKFSHLKSNSFRLLESLNWFTWQRFCLWPAPSWCFASSVSLWWALYRGEMNGTIDLESNLIIVVLDLDEMVFPKSNHGGVPAVRLYSEFWTCGIMYGWFHAVSKHHPCKSLHVSTTSAFKKPSVAMLWSTFCHQSQGTEGQSHHEEF